MKRVKPKVEKQMVVVRRSSRVANLPTPVYKEMVIIFPLLVQNFPLVKMWIIVQKSFSLLCFFYMTDSC